MDEANYRLRAIECREKAANAKDAGVREQWLDMAKQWEAAAERAAPPENARPAPDDSTTSTERHRE